MRVHTRVLLRVAGSWQMPLHGGYEALPMAWGQLDLLPLSFSQILLPLLMTKTCFPPPIHPGLESDPLQVEIPGASAPTERGDRRG